MYRQKGGQGHAVTFHLNLLVLRIFLKSFTLCTKFDKEKRNSGLISEILEVATLKLNTNKMILWKKLTKFDGCCQNQSCGKVVESLLRSRILLLLVTLPYHSSSHSWRLLKLCSIFSVEVDANVFEADVSLSHTFLMIYILKRPFNKRSQTEQSRSQTTC